MKLGAIIFVFLILVSCSPKATENDLIGKWRAYTMFTETGNYSNQIEYVEFKRNGEFLDRIEFYKPSIGNWKLLGDSLFITINGVGLKGIFKKNNSNKLTLDLIISNDNRLIEMTLERVIADKKPNE